MIHILVLEDDAKLNQAVCTYLNDYGFETKSCLHANNAYDEMYNNLYDLIISDIMMPDIDGFEFAENVRRVDKHIPILFMSARMIFPLSRKDFSSVLMITWSSLCSWMNCCSVSGRCCGGRTSKWSASWSWAIWSWMPTA